MFLYYLHFKLVICNLYFRSDLPKTVAFLLRVENHITLSMRLHKDGCIKQGAKNHMQSF